MVTDVAARSTGAGVAGAEAAAPPTRTAHRHDVASVAILEDDPRKKGNMLIKLPFAGLPVSRSATPGAGSRHSYSLPTPAPAVTIEGTADAASRRYG